jgi:hypothetical protein
MEKYSVLLLLPDFLAKTFGHDTLMDTVEADGVQAAIAAVQKKAAASNSCEDPEAFHPLCVIAGEHEDIKDKP